jgi:hypothetical protein
LVSGGQGPCLIDADIEFTGVEAILPGTFRQGNLTHEGTANKAAQRAGGIELAIVFAANLDHKSGMQCWRRHFRLNTRLHDHSKARTQRYSQNSAKANHRALIFEEL